MPKVGRDIRTHTHKHASTAGNYSAERKNDRRGIRRRKRSQVRARAGGVLLPGLAEARNAQDMGATEAGLTDPSRLGAGALLSTCVLLGGGPRKADDDEDGWASGN